MYSKIIIVISIVVFIFTSCSSNKCIYEEQRDIVGEHLRLQYTINCFNKNVLSDTITIVPYKITLDNSCSQHIKYDLWVPADNIKNNYLFLFIQGYGQKNQKEFYPIASNLIKNKYPVCFVNLRYSSTINNQKINRSLQCNEINDINEIVNFYRDNFTDGYVKIGIYGISLGSIIALNYINESYFQKSVSVNVLVCEGMPFDLTSSFKKLNTDSKNIKEVEVFSKKYSVNNIKFHRKSDINILSLWSNEDPIVSKEEIDSSKIYLLRNFHNFQYKIIPIKTHTFRNLYYSKKYKEINESIINFLLTHIGN